MSLQLVVIKATNLPNAEKFGESDPYVSIEFQGIKKKTEVIKSNLNPVWNETFDIDLKGNGLTASDELQVRVMDWERVGRNRLLAQCKVPLRNLLRGGTQSESLNLSLTDGNGRPTQAKLEMKVMYKPPATAAPASGAMGATGASPTEETQGQVMGESLLGEEEEEEEEVDPGPPQIDPATGQVIPRPKKKKRRVNKMGRRKLLENLSNKPTDFQIRVKVLEARQLQGGNIQPVAKVTVANQTKQTRVKKSTNSPSWNEAFFFNFKKSPADLMDELVEFKVFNSKKLRSDSLIGSFKCDVGMVYLEPRHSFLHKWLLLSDPEDTMSGAKGYLKVCVCVIGPGDEAPSFKPVASEESDDIESNLLRPAGVQLQPATFTLKLYRAEDIPRMDSAFMQGVKKVFGIGEEQKELVDPYFVFSFAGKEVQSKIMYNNDHPDWNQILKIGIQFPSMCERLKFIVRDWDRVTDDDTIGTNILATSLISSSAGSGFLPTFGPSFVNFYGSTREYSDLPDEYDDLNLGKGEGVAYRGRALVEIQTTLGELPEVPVEEINNDDILRVQKFMRRRKYKLHAAFLNATMVSAIDAPVEFEVSIGNYGNKLDENTAPCPSTTQPTNAVFDGCHYYFLPWSGTKPCVVVESSWEDISFRLEGLNLLLKIIDTLEANIEQVRIGIKAKLPTPELAQLLISLLDQLEQDCRKKLPEPTPGRHVSNELDRLTRDYREFELETIADNVIKLKTSATDVQEAMAEVENYLQILKNIAKEPQNSMPDVVIWMISGDKRLAYYRIPANEVLWSQNPDYIGRLCGRLQTLQLKFPGLKAEKEKVSEVPAMLRTKIWLGLANEDDAWHRMQTEGELAVYAETYENQCNIPVVGWTKKGPLGRPKWSDSQGKCSLPRESFEPPPGWRWEGDWYVSPELSMLFDKDAGHKTYMEECYEMHSRLPGTSWGPATRPWTDVKGDEMAPKDSVDLPPGWVWEDVWQIDLSRAVDEEGWEYCVESTMGGYGPVEKRYHLCRRRRWVRTRKLVEDAKQKKHKLIQESLTTIKGTESKVEDALITFAESKYATNCLQQDHMLYKMSLDVQKLDRRDPTLWEMNKALVTGLNPITTQETLVEFLEPPAGVELLSLVRGEQENAAILVFAEKPDFAKMSNQCKETTLEGNTLFVQMVMKCQSIYVKGIDKSITCNLLENFFCNKRKSGGGDIEKVDYHPEDGYCIVYFENPSDARNVAAQEKFTIDKREVQAEMFYPCLGLSEKPTNREDMPCVSYESNVYVINFVQNCGPAFSQINEALQKKFVKIKWPKSKSDFIIKLQCTMTKDMKNSKEILISWKEEATVEMDRHMKRFVYKLHSILPEAWSLFLTRLKTLNIGDPIKVNVVLEQENHTAILTGYEENTEALTRTILDFIKTEESKIKNQNRIMKNVPLDFHKCQKIWETHFWKKLKSDFPDLVFQVKNIKKEVNLTGKPAKVNEALIKINEYLMITKSKSFNISKGRYEIFSMKEVKDRFIEEMKAKRNMAVWNVTDDKVYMTSSNLEMVDDALETFKKFIPEEKIKIRDIGKVLSMPDWQACVKKLKDSYDKKMFISYQNSEVCVTATIYIFETVYKQIEHELKIYSEKCRIDSKEVHLSLQQFRYMQMFGQNEISKIKKSCTPKKLEIKLNQSTCSIEITGNNEDVKKAYEKLMRSIHVGSCSITNSGAPVLLTSGIGRETAKRAGKEASCIRYDEEGVCHNREIRETESFKGQRRTSKCLPIKIAECKLQLCDKKLVVMQGDVTKLEVDVIVNAANGELDHCGGLALAVSTAGGKIIQEDSRTYCKSHGTVSHGEAVPAHPGELPCKMLIHAVGPRWRNGGHDEEHLLKKAISRCLELTDKYNYSSIAIPALSAGFYGYPAAQLVEVILRAIESYNKIISSSIKEIYFCDVNDTIVKEFVKALKTKYGLKVKEFYGYEYVKQFSVQNTDSHLEEEKSRKSRPRSDIDNSEMKVISGNLAKMRQVDVIVNSTNKSLNLNLGATSKSLLRAGGEFLQEECRMKYKHGVQPGEVAMTKGGNLHCRQVYHGAIKKWDHNKGDALSRFTEFVENCLRMADKNRMRSMAFPALGTGRLGYPPDLAAKTMLKCCRDFLHQKRSTSLKEIIFVVYHEDKETFEAFQSVMKSECVSRRTVASSFSHPQRQSTGRIPTRRD